MPSKPRNARTIRSAAPLSIIAFPVIAASAMTTPTVPAVRPKPSATRPIFTAASPGASKLTTIAAVISARNALRRNPTIPTRIVAIPTNRISNGCMDARRVAAGNEGGHALESPDHPQEPTWLMMHQIMQA